MSLDKLRHRLHKVRFYGSFFPKTIPLISASSLMAIANGSIAITNNNGDNGHPCLVPRDKTNLDDRTPFVTTEEVGSVYKILTYLAKVSPKPKRSNTENIYGHSTLSNAFSASNEMTTPPFAQKFEWLIILSNRLTLWDDDLPLTKPV